MHAVHAQPGAGARPYLIAIDGERLVSWQASNSAALAVIPAAPARGKGQQYWASAASAKCVLMILAEAADETGFTFISVSTIARRAEMSRRATQGALSRLEAQCLIAREMRHRPGDGGRTSDGVQLLIVLPRAGSAPTPAQVLRGAQANPARTPRKACALTSTELVSEPGESAHARSQNDSKEVPISPTWEPPEDAYDFGASIGLTNTEVEAETAKFKDWHLARTHTSLSADWAATWRLWMRRASERKAERSKSGGTVGAKPAAVDGKRWSGPDEILELVAVAGVTEWYLVAYFNWQELPERALVTKSATAFDKVRSCERALREAGWKLLLRQERAA